KGLKVGYHRTFGYYWEVPRSQAGAVPQEWLRRQGLVNAERFTSPELIQLADAIQQGTLELVRREREAAVAVRDGVLERAEALRQAAAWVAEVDAWAAAAEAAARHGWVAVEWDPAAIRVEDLRHPVLETLIPDYVPSDLILEEPVKAAVLTGPNMGGKSTYMRALALNVVLAQAVGMAAARRARLPIFDGVYVRMGAGDDLLRGQSTFMVEMEEVAAILRQAGPRSLVLLDELGRGTSTYDGLAIAWAVLERLAREEGPWTCFATHYHELTALAGLRPVRNLAVEVAETGGGPVFTHRVREGTGDRSYGLEVARQAGLPAAVVARAERLLKDWERQGRPQPPERGGQLTWFEAEPLSTEVLATLARLDLDSLSPREAWEWLADWKRRLSAARTAQG
ncbi:MAG: DNA mismatch repair protein MutS, partial [Firmicutes bacterium]|nr:DNA mismatch repair protein MutS [Bacillota bacterium]